MLIMVEKGIRGGMCHSIYRYAKVNKKYMKDYDKNKDLIFDIGIELNHMVGQRRKSFQQIILLGSKIFFDLMNVS